MDLLKRGKNLGLPMGTPGMWGGLRSRDGEGQKERGGNKRVRIQGLCGVA